MGHSESGVDPPRPGSGSRAAGSIPRGGVDPADGRSGSRAAGWIRLPQLRFQWVPGFRFCRTAARCDRAGALQSASAHSVQLRSLWCSLPDPGLPSSLHLSLPSTRLLPPPSSLFLKRWSQTLSLFHWPLGLSDCNTHNSTQQDSTQNIFSQQLYSERWGRGTVRVWSGHHATLLIYCSTMTSSICVAVLGFRG